MQPFIYKENMIILWIVPPHRNMRAITPLIQRNSRTDNSEPSPYYSYNTVIREGATTSHYDVGPSGSKWGVP